MFNLRLCNAATIRYSLLKFGHMHLCGEDYKHFSPHCCKCNSFGCIAAIRCVNACHGPHSDSVYSGSEHRQFNSPRLVKREAGFPNRRRALIGSNQLWRVNDSPYYREYWLHRSVLLTNTVSTMFPSSDYKFCSDTGHGLSWSMQLVWSGLIDGEGKSYVGPNFLGTDCLVSDVSHNYWFITELLILLKLIAAYIITT